MYRCDVRSSISDIPEDVWNALAPSGDPLWRWPHFQIMERSGIGPEGFEYIVLTEQDRVVAVLPAFWYRSLPLTTTLHPALDRLLEAGRQVTPGILGMPVYFCGNPLGEGRILSNGDLDVHTIGLLFACIEERTRHHDLKWIFLKDFHPATSKDLMAVPKVPSYFDFDGLPDARLDINYRSFDDFVATRSTNTRRGIRKRIKAFQKHKNLRLETIHAFDRHSPEIKTLYETVFERAKLTLDRLSPDYFRSVAQDDQIDHRFIACFDGDQMVGYILNLFHDSGGVCFRGGFDYQTSHEAGVYFILQYESIRQAIAAGCRRLSFCQATYRPKLQLGCDLVPLRNIVWHRNPLLRPALRRAMPALFARYRSHCGLGPGAVGTSASNTSPLPASGRTVPARNLSL